MKEILKKYDIFDPISPIDLGLLARMAVLKEYKKGDVICHEDETCSHFHLLHRGKVKIVKHTSVGKDVILDIATSGERFMEEPLYDGGKYPASVIAAEDSSVLMIDKTTFQRVTGQYIEMMKIALRGLGQRLRSQQELIRELSVGKVDTRIANMMLKLGEKIGETSGDGQIMMHISLSRQDIADLTGTTIETAIRTMSRLSKKEILKTTKDSIHILDRDQLEDIAAGF